MGRAGDCPCFPKGYLLPAPFVHPQRTKRFTRSLFRTKGCLVTTISTRRVSQFLEKLSHLQKGRGHGLARDQALSPGRCVAEPQRHRCDAPPSWRCTTARRGLSCSRTGCESFRWSHQFLCMLKANSTLQEEQSFAAVRKECAIWACFQVWRLEIICPEDKELPWRDACSSLMEM